MLKQQRARFAYYLILPSVILITLLNVVPLVEGVIVSLQKQNMIRPNPTAFVGFKHYYRALFLIPWVIPDVATALLWKWLYADEYGVINHLLRMWGLISRPIQWLADPNMAMASVIMVQIWKLTPVMFIVLLAALQNVPKELHEAAELDGAGPIQRFRYVTFQIGRASCRER